MSQLSSTPANIRSAVSTEVKEFAIVALHSAPSDAVAEINSLYDVYLDVQQKWDLNVSPPRCPRLGLWGPPLCIVPRANPWLSPGRMSC